MTSLVFVGFIYLIVYDLQSNISKKPYTFEVRDKYMSPEEHLAERVEVGEGEKSQELMIGFAVQDENGNYEPGFDPLNNDYFQLTSTYWDTERNFKEGKDFLYHRDGPELQLCGKDKEVGLLGVGVAYWR